MPLYEYLCKKCGHRFEKLRMFSDKPIKKCPECGGAVEQLISASAVQFKGSGWYVTDYGKKGTTSSSKSSESDGESKGESQETAKDKESKDPKEAKKETKKDDKPRAESPTRKHKKG